MAARRIARGLASVIDWWFLDGAVAAMTKEYRSMPALVWRDRISLDPQVCHGQPCIRGTRVMVSLILDFLANGDSVEAVLEAYPSLARDDVRACLGYAAVLARERIVSLEELAV